MTEKRNITDYHYDAFISYRHLPKDMAVADKLQKLLEKHKIVIKGEHRKESCGYSGIRQNFLPAATWERISGRPWPSPVILSSFVPLI